MSSIKWPFWVLILDVVGTLLLALGLYGLFGGDELLFSQTVNLRALSIPLMVWASQLILRLMDRYPMIILGGGALLGWIALSMAITDPVLMPVLDPYERWLSWVAPISGALLVLITGKWAAARRPAPSEEIIDLIAQDQKREKEDKRA